MENAEELDCKFRKSLELLTAKVLPEKILFLQVSGSYKMDPPLGKEPDEQGLRPRGRWSHDNRPLPYDGGYLPVVEVTKAVLGTGFKGWFSIEVFDGQGPKKYPDDMGPYAKKAMSSLERLARGGWALGEYFQLVRIRRFPGVDKKRVRPFEHRVILGFLVVFWFRGGVVSITLTDSEMEEFLRLSG